MKKKNLLFWVFTSVLSLEHIVGSILEIIQHRYGIEPYVELGYPIYFATFMGIARLTAVTAILIPSKYIKVKEWGYALLTFDVIGAIYSHLATMQPVSYLIFPVLTLLLIFGSYYFYRIRLNIPSARVSIPAK